MLLLVLVLVHTYGISHDWIKIERKFKKHLNPFLKGNFLIMVESGRKWSKVVESGRKWSEMVGNGRKWLKMVVNGQKWVVIEDCG